MDYQIGRLVLTSHRQLCDGGKRLAIGNRALEVLSVLAEAETAVVTKDELMDRVWHGVTVEENALHVHIAAIRRALGDAAGLLTTLHGKGYQLWAEKLDRPIPAARAAEPADPVVAVLAFDELGDGSNWFGEGVAEEILLNVSRIPGLKTISRSSSFQLRGRERTAIAVADLLGASHVIDGSVRRHGDQLRVIAQLATAPDGVLLWSDAFDGTMDNLLHVQNAVADAVAIALKKRFAPRTRIRQIKPEAYDLYLQARQIIKVDTLRPDCIAQLRSAVDLDPALVEAWGSLALVLAESARWDSHASSFDALAEEVRTAAQQALALDPTAPNAHLALGMLEPFAHYARREVFLDRARRSTNLFPDTLRQFGEFAFGVGRVREGATHYETGWRMDPLSPQANADRSYALAQLGQFAQCYEAYRHARTKRPDIWQFVFDPVMFAAFEGDWPEVDRLLADAGPKGPELRLAERTAEALRHPSSSVRQRNLELARRQLAETGWVDQSLLIFLHALGLCDEAFELAANSCYDYLFRRDGRGRDGIGFHVGIIFGPAAKAMRQDPRFVRLCTRLGLSDYWAKTQKWPDFADDVTYDLPTEVERDLNRPLAG